PTKTRNKRHHWTDPMRTSQISWFVLEAVDYRLFRTQAATRQGLTHAEELDPGHEQV
ncbi:hypothetical protein CHARACLAT_016716, partial [Characodon lateralis]|nr:hypothetical protein [Characodon lateralis]